MTYRRRLEARRKRYAEEAERLAIETRMDAEMVILHYERAYQAANGRRPLITYHRGWYKIHGHSYRRGAVVKMADALNARVHEREIQDGNGD